MIGGVRIGHSTLSSSSSSSAPCHASLAAQLLLPQLLLPPSISTLPPCHRVQCSSSSGACRQASKQGGLSTDPLLPKDLLLPLDLDLDLSLGLDLIMGPDNWEGSSCLTPTWGGPGRYPCCWSAAAAA